ncbi:MAG TPA: response regulator [Thermodesulfobacteriota bacterium]|nr:response regulator [Thermodesulfobacteriota bacterium]
MKPKRSVLIVDDEADVREALCRILKPLYEVHTAGNGREALRRIRGQNVDLVALDLKMPGMSGIEVLREIKRMKDDIEVIIITAYGNPESAGEAIYYGAGDFIVKPFDISQIATKVHQSLERRHNGLRIKNLIQQIKDHPLQGEDGREEKLLFLSKNLCQVLEEGESSDSPATDESLKVHSNPDHPCRTTH